jgi:hypothetical protein
MLATRTAPTDALITRGGRGPNYYARISCTPSGDSTDSVPVGVVTNPCLQIPVDICVAIVFAASDLGPMGS